MFAGYYRNREATSEVLTSDGWLKSGDIGKQVCLRINTDRPVFLFVFVFVFQVN